MCMFRFFTSFFLQPFQGYVILFIKSILLQSLFDYLFFISFLVNFLLIFCIFRFFPFFFLKPFHAYFILFIKSLLFQTFFIYLFFIPFLASSCSITLGPFDV